MSFKKHLIIGCGRAALSALESIRKVTWEDDVKLVTEDDSRPYSPAALPYLLAGMIPEAKLWTRDAAYFKSLRSTLATGKRVVGLRTEEKTAIYLDGTSETYDDLIIASGSEAVKPPITGIEDVDVHEFRTLADCRRLARSLESSKSVAILGGGMVGMQLAAALTGTGRRVMVIEREPSILCQQFDLGTAAAIQEIFIHRGCTVYAGRPVLSIARNGGRLRITLSDGTSLETDLLINATGTRGKASFARGTGLEIGNGILVDRSMRTRIDSVYAAGDVARAPDFQSGQPVVSANIAGAVLQGKIAGTNAAGGRAEYEGVIPTAALHFFGSTAFSVGRLTPGSAEGRVLAYSDADRSRSRRLVFDGHHLIGGTFLNENDRLPGTVLWLIRSRADLSQHEEALFERSKSLSDPWLRSIRGEAAVE